MLILNISLVNLIGCNRDESLENDILYLQINFDNKKNFIFCYILYDINMKELFEYKFYDWKEQIIYC